MSRKEPFADVKDDAIEDPESTLRLGSSAPMQNRCLSREWDASKVPPSQFQKRKGSIYATQGSRDGHVDRNLQNAYLDKLKEKKWDK
ncbi:MAG: hypothetical protein M1818_006101 [Claussenomyces sp. TS43310]|nr:MAG: hypothetical protein M1818_006101 [Claussenomyces sp. TS43310]